MKKEHEWFKYAIIFILGCLVSYFLSQFKFLKINTEVNVVESLLALITAFIGLYIAISIQKKSNRNQSLHNLLQSKLDSILSTHSTFENKIANQSTIKLDLATRYTKTLYQDLSNLKTLFNSFNLQCNCVDEIEKSLDELDNLLTNNIPVSSNTLQLTQQKNSIIKKLNSMTNRIAAAYVVVNKVL